MTSPRPPSEMTDAEMEEAVRDCARRILAHDDPTHWCVYVDRMRALLEELRGQPIEHGDHLFWFRSEKRVLP